MGRRVPSGSPPRPQGASSPRCGRRALRADPLAAPAPSGSGPRGAAPADVSPGFPTPGASPPPRPRALQRGRLSGGSWSASPGPPQKTGLGVRAAQETVPPSAPRLRVGTLRHGPLAGCRPPGLVSRAPGCQTSSLRAVGRIDGRFWGVCGSRPGRAAGVQASLMACSAFSFSFSLSRVRMVFTPPGVL